MPMTIDPLGAPNRDGQPAAALQVLHLVANELPGLRFEYHARSRGVYLIRIGANPEVAELLAREIPDIDHAKQVVQVFRQGFREAATVRIGQPAPVLLT